MWNPALIAIARAYDEAGAELAGLRLNVDNRLRCAEVEPFVVEPAKPILDFGGPRVSFKLFFPEGEAQALATVNGLAGWRLPDA